MVREEGRSRERRGLVRLRDNKTETTEKSARHKIRRGRNECDEEIGLSD